MSTPYFKTDKQKIQYEQTVKNVKEGKVLFFIKLI